MISIKEHMPKSAKVLPCWVFINGKYDLAYLTEDEKILYQQITKEHIH